ncbi:MAG: hypothetical protein IPM54_10235 [Polyangiaceae bacterium]|nr:hypothetical protein [Polyangiaceae bacterium]
MLQEEAKQGRYPDAAAVRTKFGDRFLDGGDGAELSIRRTVLKELRKLETESRTRESGALIGGMPQARRAALKRATLNVDMLTRVAEANGNERIRSNFDSLLRFLDDVFRARLEHGPKSYPGDWANDFRVVMAGLERTGHVLGYAKAYIEAEQLRWKNAFDSLARRERGPQQAKFPPRWAKSKR